MESGHNQDHSRGVLPQPPETMFNSTPSVPHGQRRQGLRLKKSVDDYVAQYNEELSSETLNKDGRFLEVLVCKLCNVVVGARTDRIKEHLNSRRHQKLKSVKPDAMLLSQAQPEQKQIGSFESNESNSTQTIPNVIASTSTPLQEQTGIFQNSGPAKPGGKDGLKIRWNGFDSNIRTMCKKYLDSTDFSDVALWVEGKLIKCHRLILAAGSPYFDKLFREFEQHGCPQAAIIPLPGFRFSDVQTIIQFIYTGEFEVRNEDFQGILVVAGFLEIQCLMELDQKDKIPRVTRVGKGRGNNDQTEVGNTMDGGVKKAKVKFEVVEPSHQPNIEPVPGPHNKPMNTNPGFHFYNHINSMNCTSGATCVNVNGNGQTNAYNYNHLHPAPAGMTGYNPIGLNRGIVDLMTGFWDRQQMPNLPYTDYSEFRPMYGNQV